MQVFTRIKQHSDTIVKFLPLLAFVIPLALLYGLNLPDPYLKVSTQDSFQLMWKGRTFQLFFIWLVALQFILSWETIQLKINKHSSAELAAFAIAFLLPTVYVVSEYYFGLNAAIANFSFQSGVPFWYSMPLAVEYIAFSGLFFVVIFLSLGKKGLTGFALPGLFAALVGIIYTIDNVFPDGQFTPFQLLVPTTATLAAKVLGLMGYATSMSSQNGMPVLQATGPLGNATFSIAWPCAGIESLLIFTAVSLLLLQQMHLSWKAKVGYFVFGAAITYFINIMRIVNIFTIGAQYGANSSQVQMFHFYYGPLYAIAWIVSYPLVILVSQIFWRKIRNEKIPDSKKLQRPPLSPV